MGGMEVPKALGKGFLAFIWLNESIKDWTWSKQYLSGHGRHVPHIADDGPAGHYSKQVAHHVVFATVPERVTKLGVVLQENNHLSHEFHAGFSQPNQSFSDGKINEPIRPRENRLPLIGFLARTKSVPLMPSIRANSFAK